MSLSSKCKSVSRACKQAISKAISKIARKNKNKTKEPEYIELLDREMIVDPKEPIVKARNETFRAEQMAMLSEFAVSKVMKPFALNVLSPCLMATPASLIQKFSPISTRCKRQLKRDLGEIDDLAVVTACSADHLISILTSRLRVSAMAEYLATAVPKAHECIIFFEKLATNTLASHFNCTLKKPHVSRTSSDVGHQLVHSITSWA